MFPFDAGFVPFSDYSPGCDRMTATRSFACTTTHRMVDRIFSNSAAQWPNSAMASPSGFAQDNVFMLSISNLADRAAPLLVVPPVFPRGPTDLAKPFIA